MPFRPRINKHDFLGQWVVILATSAYLFWMTFSKEAMRATHRRTGEPEGTRTIHLGKQIGRGLLFLYLYVKSI